MNKSSLYCIPLTYVHHLIIYEIILIYVTLYIHAMFDIIITWMLYVNFDPFLESCAFTSCYYKHKVKNQK
jgi:hypothetical protein